MKQLSNNVDPRVWLSSIADLHASWFTSLIKHTRWDWTNKAISSDQVLSKSLWTVQNYFYKHLYLKESHSTSNCRSKIIKHLYIHNFKSTDKFQISFLLKFSKIAQRMLKYVPKHTKQQIIAYNKKGTSMKKNICIMLGVIFLKQTITSVIYIYIYISYLFLFVFTHLDITALKSFLKEEFNYNKHLIMH